jgi:hypothetical protein
MSFLMHSGTYHNPDVKHLFVVCTEVDVEGNVILTPVSSWKNSLSDRTCRLEIGCHPFVVKASHILYRNSRIEPVSVIEKGLVEGLFKKRDDCNAELMERVTEGIGNSPHTPWKIKRHYKRLNA